MRVHIVNNSAADHTVGKCSDQQRCRKHAQQAAHHDAPPPERPAKTELLLLLQLLLPHLPHPQVEAPTCQAQDHKQRA
jgi:hypothetical protein